MGRFLSLFVFRMGVFCRLFIVAFKLYYLLVSEEPLAVWPGGLFLFVCYGI